jgi:hypothetical protein
MSAYTEIINTASEAATLAVLRALGSGAPSPSHFTDGNQPEADVPQPFRRTCPRAVAAT